MDWDDLRFFLELLHSKSLTTAARQLGVTQSTVGRRLGSLESHLGARLLRRTREGYVCTPAGEAIRQRVERIAHEAQSIERMVGGLDFRLCGTVRIAAPVFLASRLARLTVTLQAQCPELTLELASCQPAGLAHGGWDILMQLEPFTQPTLVVRRIGRLAFGFYASIDYLRRLGEPRCATGCRGHTLVALDDSVVLPGESDWLAANAWQARPGLRTDCRETQIRATAQSAGVALLPCLRAEQQAALVRLETQTPPPVADIWIALRQETRAVPRVRAVLDCIVDALRCGEHGLDRDWTAGESSRT